MKKSFFTTTFFFLVSILIVSVLFSCNSTGGIPIPGEDARISKNIASEYYQIAEGYMGIKNYTKAAEYYKLAMRDKNVKLQAYYKLGRCYALAKNWSEAETVFNDLLKRDENNVDLKISLAYIYAMQGENKKAMDLYEALKKENPTNQTIAENHLALSIAILEDKKNAGAKDEKKELDETELKTLENDFKTFKEFFPDSTKMNDFEEKVKKLIPEIDEKQKNETKPDETKPTSEAGNVSRA